MYESGFKEELKCTPNDTSFQEENDQGTRKRKIIWLNPPNSRSVKTNISKNFLHLLVKHFPANNKLQKKFNNNTVKVSYSFMKNMGSIISGHNHNIINLKQKSFGYNCKKKDKCLWNDECLTPKVIYRADVQYEANNNQTFYFGLAEATFKECYNNHKRDVKHIKYRYNTEVTMYIWNLKNNSIMYNIYWNLVDKVYGNANSTMCKLCLTENLWIINHINDNNIINKKSELINKRKHLNKFLLKHVKKKQWTWVLYIFVFLYFYSKLTKYVSLFIFREKRYQIPDDCFCMKLRVAWRIFEFYLTAFEIKN